MLVLKPFAMIRGVHGVNCSSRSTDCTGTVERDLDELEGLGSILHALHYSTLGEIFSYSPRFGLRIKPSAMQR